VSVCLCVGHTDVLANMDEQVEVPFGRLTHVGLEKRIIYESQLRTNPFAAARGERRRCGLLPNYFVHVLPFVISCSVRLLTLQKSLNIVEQSIILILV